MRASRAPASIDHGKSYATCGAKRTRGEGRCARPAGWGTDHPGYGSCKWHAGSTPNGRAAARMEMARDSLERLGVAAPLTPVNPLDLLGDLIDQLAAIVDEAERLLERLAAAGVDYDEVTTTLEREGVETFEGSFRALLERIRGKRQLLLASASPP